MQNLSASQAKNSIAVSPHDPLNWHQGIEHYGFWAIVVQQEDWLKAFQRARAHVKTLVLPDYQRAPHITLSACGLVDRAHFCEEKLARQIRALEELKLSPFSLESLGLDSFETAPYLSINKHPLLLKIRGTLESICQDNPACDYHPHLTLGFYKQSYSLSTLQRHLSGYTQPVLPSLSVQSLCYCTYQTKEIQGNITIRHTLPLS